MTLNLHMPETDELKPRIVVFGVGGAGGNAVNNMLSSNLEGVEFVVANTDAQALSLSLADNRIQLGRAITHGLGAGAKPEVGRAAAEESADEISDYIAGSHMCFITAGMGGGTGTGAAPVVARLARQNNVLTVGVVTKPFQFEGAQRMRMADSGIEELAEHVDTLIIIPNQNLFRVANERTTFQEAFALADEVLHSGVRGITDLMVMPGLINLDFADVRSVMSEMGKAMMGTGEASGERRAVDAAEAAIANPLLDDVSMMGARGVLINITGGMDLTLFEVDEAANRVRTEVDPDANIIIGSTFNEAMNGQMRVSVVATGIDAVMENNTGRGSPRPSERAFAEKTEAQSQASAASNAAAATPRASAAQSATAQPNSASAAASARPANAPKPAPVAAPRPAVSDGQNDGSTVATPRPSATPQSEGPSGPPRAAAQVAPIASKQVASKSATSAQPGGPSTNANGAVTPASKPPQQSVTPQMVEPVMPRATAKAEARLAPQGSAPAMPQRVAQTARPRPAPSDMTAPGGVAGGAAATQSGGTRRQDGDNKDVFDFTPPAPAPREQPALNGEAFVPPPPAQAESKPAFSPVRPTVPGAPQHHAEAEQQAPSEPQPKRRGFGLFERMTGTRRRDETQDERVAPTITEAQPYDAGEPTPPREPRAERDERIIPPVDEDDELEIPAFLRRQVN